MDNSFLKPTKTIQKRSSKKPVPSPDSQYKTFLNTHIIPKITAKKGKTAQYKREARQWKDVDLKHDPDKIVDEIAKKFNKHNKLGIGSVLSQRSPGKHNFYEGKSPDGQTRMTLNPPAGDKVKVAEGPTPFTVGHELVHANDHQIDFLNPLVWSRLETLATTGGNHGTSMGSFDEFERSIGKIQDKIAPGGEFKPDPAVPDSGYSFGPDYIKYEMQGAEGKPYKVPLYNASSAPDWPTLFNDISLVLNRITPKDSVKNQGFYFNRGSEFPAFMSERLTEPWGTAAGPNPLSVPEAKFVHGTLQDMGNAYPNLDYPTINQYILQRRKSIENAFPRSFRSASPVADEAKDDSD